jgi:hypothetical protein
VTTDNAPVITIPESDTHWESRSQFRRGLEDRLRDGLLEAEVDVVGGPMDGVAVVTHAAWSSLLSGLTSEPLPPVSDHAAEVITHATITVWAVCPRCKIAGPILVTIEPELRVDDAGGELRVKAKAKARTHVCGQLTIPSAPQVEGQESFDLADIVDETDAESDPESCPWPGCEGEAGHQGAHITAVDDTPDGKP